MTQGSFDLGEIEKFLLPENNLLFITGLGLLKSEWVLKNEKMVKTDRLVFKKF